MAGVPAPGRHVSPHVRSPTLAALRPSHTHCSLGLVPRIWGSYSVAMPNPIPVTFVSGTPIEVPRKPDATEAEVAALAERFYRELQAVAERHAAESEEHAHLRLEFVSKESLGGSGSKAE